ncbi:MAG: hypothetical protein ACI31V_05530 [Bacilli bacterium]
MNTDEIYILDKKIKKFNNTIDKFKKENIIDDLLLKEELNDLLGQFEVCLKNIYVPKKYGALISAIKYANNMKKHSKSIFRYSVYTLEVFPSDDLYPSDELYPSDFKIWWNELPLDKKEYQNQYNCYNRYLSKMDLPESINNIYSIIKKLEKLHSNRKM